MNVEKYTKQDLWSFPLNPVVNHVHRTFPIGVDHCIVTNETQQIEADFTRLPIGDSIERNRIIYGKVSLDNYLWFDYTQMMITSEFPNGFSDIRGVKAEGSPVRDKILKYLAPSVLRLQKAAANGDPNVALTRCGGDITWITGINLDGTLQLQDPSKIQWATYNAYWGRTNTFGPIFYVQSRLGNYEDGGFGYANLIEDILQRGMECPLFAENVYSPREGGRIFDAVPTDPIEIGALDRSSCVCIR